MDTDRGTFVATAATPRALLASRVASCLSTDEMAILTALNAGIPRDLLQGQPRGYRMYQLVGISTPAAAAEKIISLSPDCTLSVDALRKKFSELDDFTASVTSDQRGKLVPGSLRLILPEDKTRQQVARAEEAGREAVRAAACTINSQLTVTAVERAALSGSNRKLQKGDSLLTHRRTKGAGRRHKVAVGGVCLQSLSRDCLALHRSNHCRLALRLPTVFGLHMSVGDSGGQMFARVSRSEKGVGSGVEEQEEEAAGIDMPDMQENGEAWMQVCVWFVCQNYVFPPPLLMIVRALCASPLLMLNFVWPSSC